MSFGLLALAVASASALADGVSPHLLAAGKSPPPGWSVAVFTVAYGGGGRVKVGNSERCQVTFASPCHFAMPDGTHRVLVDQPLEFGDTSAKLTATGQRVYTIVSSIDGSRAVARGFAGVLGSMAMQPTEASNPPPKGGGAVDGANPLTDILAGSPFNIEVVAVSDGGKASAFVTPAAEQITYPLR